MGCIWIMAIVACTVFGNTPMGVGVFLYRKAVTGLSPGWRLCGTLGIEHNKERRSEGAAENSAPHRSLACHLSSKWRDAFLIIMHTFGPILPLLQSYALLLPVPRVPPSLHPGLSPARNAFA